MTIAIDPRPDSPVAPVARITATEFLKSPAADGPSELVHGEVLYSSPAGGRDGRIARNMAFALNAFVEPRALGEVFTDGTGFALPAFDNVVRSPDAAFVQAGRLPADDLPAGWVPTAPDLVVEVHAAGQPTRWIAYDGMLDGSPALPGFSLPVAAVVVGVRPIA